MKLKKFNAILSLTTSLVLIVHILNQIITYALFVYNPIVSRSIASVLILLFLLHGGVGISMLFASHDSQNIKYKKLNLRTVFQRITACIIMVLLPVHGISFAIMSRGCGPVLYTLLEVTKFLFYGSVTIHFALSFGNALVTLGLLENRKKKRVLDLILLILAIAFTIGFGIYITVCQRIILGV